MRLLLSGLTAGVLVLSACGPAATAPSAAPTVAATASPTPVPTPQTKFVFTAELKPSNEVPPIANAEASCTGKGTFTLNTTKDAAGAVTAATAVFETDITGCPAGTEINIGHIHKAAAGVNGGVVVNSGLAKGELTLTGGAGKINKTAAVVDAGGLTAAALATDIIANPQWRRDHSRSARQGLTGCPSSAGTPLGFGRGAFAFQERSANARMFTSSQANTSAKRSRTR